MLLDFTDAFYINTGVTKYAYLLADDSAQEDAAANLRGAAKRIRATQNFMHARGMAGNVNYRELQARDLRVRLHYIGLCSWAALFFCP